MKNLTTKGLVVVEQLRDRVDIHYDDMTTILWGKNRWAEALLLANAYAEIEDDTLVAINR